MLNKKTLILYKLIMVYFWLNNYFLKRPPLNVCIRIYLYFVGLQYHCTEDPGVINLLKLCIDVVHT